MRIIVNTSSMIPLYEQLMDQIKALIRTGELQENDSLPSVRTLAKELKNRHSQRVQAGLCTLGLGFVFNDCVNNLERVAAHCSTIALTVLEGSNAQLQSHNYLRNLKEDNKEEFRGISSMNLLTRVKSVMDAHGAKLVNLDATLVMQRPKVAPYIEKMRNNIAFALMTDASRINVKATTEEHLGFTGREEGVSAHCVALLELNDGKAVML